MLGLLFSRTALPLSTLPCMDLNAVFILVPSKSVSLDQNCSEFHSSIPNALLIPTLESLTDMLILTMYERTFICMPPNLSSPPLHPTTTRPSLYHLRYGVIPVPPFPHPYPHLLQSNEKSSDMSSKMYIGSVHFSPCSDHGHFLRGSRLVTPFTFVLAHFQSNPVVANMILEKSDYFSCLLKPLPLLPLHLKSNFLP